MVAHLGGGLLEGDGVIGLGHEGGIKYWDKSLSSSSFFSSSPFTSQMKEAHRLLLPNVPKEQGQRDLEMKPQKPLIKINQPSV